MGTSSGTRVRLDSSSRPIGSGRSDAEAHSPWLVRGALVRNALPAAYRSTRVEKVDIPSEEEVDTVIFHVLSLVRCVWSRSDGSSHRSRAKTHALSTCVRKRGAEDGMKHTPSFAPLLTLLVLRP